jgi:hypothetical protein
VAQLVLVIVPLVVELVVWWRRSAKGGSVTEQWRTEARLPPAAPRIPGWVVPRADELKEVVAAVLAQIVETSRLLLRNDGHVR